MKIVIYVEQDEMFSDDVIKFKGEYNDIVSAEAGLQNLADKYLKAKRAIQPEIDSEMLPHTIPTDKEIDGQLKEINEGACICKGCESQLVCGHKKGEEHEEVASCSSCNG